VPAFRPYKNRRSKRIVLKKSASLVVNLERIAKRLPCPQAVTTSSRLGQKVLLRKDRSYGTKGWKRQDKSTCSEYQ